MNKGWECPKCGQCFAPTVLKCDTCSNIGDTASNGTSLLSYYDPDKAYQKGDLIIRQGINDEHEKVYKCNTHLTWGGFNENFWEKL